MEREILFRGKRSDNGEWIYGSLIQHDISIICSADEQREVDPATVGQYTGLKNKNGKKIFEGDIMRFVAYGLEYVGVVTFIDGNFGILCETASPFLDHAIERHDAKAIGNIYDNPELLEAKE